MSTNPYREKAKAFGAIVAAITGASLMVFTGMAAHYKSVIKETELRYEAVQSRLEDEKYITQEDVQTILRRISAVEAGVNELKHKVEEQESVQPKPVTIK